MVPSPCNWITGLRVGFSIKDDLKKMHHCVVFELSTEKPTLQSPKWGALKPAPSKRKMRAVPLHWFNNKRKGKKRFFSFLPISTQFLNWELRILEFPKPKERWHLEKRDFHENRIPKQVNKTSLSMKEKWSLQRQKLLSSNLFTSVPSAVFLVTRRYWNTACCLLQLGWSTGRSQI